MDPTHLQNSWETTNMQLFLESDIVLCCLPKTESQRFKR